MNYKIKNNRIGKEYDLVATILELPVQGVWLARNLNVDSQDDFKDGDSVSITFLDKTLSGTFQDTVNYNGYVKGTVVGGKNTMSLTLDSLSYNGVSVKTFANYIATQTGQPLDSASDQNLLNTSITRFEKLTASASDMLDKVLQPYNAIWKVTTDGKLFIGYETHPDISVKYPTLIQGRNLDVLDKQQDLGFWSVYNEEILLEPIFSIDGNNVKEVVYDLNTEERDNITVKLDFYDPAHVLSYKLNSQVRDTLYHKKYRMKVSQQKSDGTLTIFPDPDNALLKNGLRDVPIVYPMPNMKIEVKPGAICYVEFANGDPGFPIVSSWNNNDKLTKVTFAASGTAKKVARVDDLVDMGTLVISAAPMTGVITGTYTPPGGMSVPVTAGSIALKSGKITTGSDIVLSG